MLGYLHRHRELRFPGEPEERVNMDKFKDGDIVRWFLNSSEYITGVVVEVCGDGTYWVEHSNGQQRHYKETELVLDNHQN